MTVIAISSFLGENRAAEPKLIQDGQGTVSLNQKPGRGDLRPWREPAQVFTAPGGTKTIYRMGRGVSSDTLYWLAWPNVVHTALGFDAEDTTERTAYTGDGAPKVTSNLALSSSQPTTNPTASRPLGLPAPDTALTANVVLPAPDPDEGKYRLLITAKQVAALTGGSEYRLSVDGREAQTFTLPGTETSKVSAAELVVLLTGLQGIKAVVADEKDEDAPLGVKVTGTEVGKAFTLERLTGTTQNYDAAAATLTQLFSSVGNIGPTATLLRATATTSAGFNVVITDAMLETLAAGDTLTCTVSGNFRFGVTIGGNSRSSVVAALTAGGVQATAQDYVPGGVVDYSESSSGNYEGQPGGVRINVGATSTAATVEIQRSSGATAALVITQDWLAANAKGGDKWQVQIGQAAPVAITLTAGANTYPPAVTPASLKQALSAVSKIVATEESTGGSTQLRIEAIGSGASITIKKITPAATKVWGEAAAATVIGPKKREVADYFYVYTYVNDWGWESAPSPVSAAVERTIDETVVLSNLASPPGGGYNINRVRVYRTQAGTTGNADFFFLLEVAASVATVKDTGQEIGEVLATKKWLPAPGVPRGGATNLTEQNLHTLTPMWNGMLAGITNGAVRFCEAYVPYAWPIGYDAVPPDGRAVGLGVFGQNLLVLTTGKPILVSGSSPDSLDQAPLDIPQGCIAPRSVVSMGAGVAWASNDGLCWYGAGGARVLTAGVLLREDWLKLRPETIIGQMYEGLYFGSYEPSPGAPRKGFMVDPSGGAGIFFLSEGFDAAHFDSVQDQLYVLRGTRILKWDAAEGFMSATFRSKTFRQPQPTTFSCAEVVASAYPVRLTVLADGVQRFSAEVHSREPLRLPAGFRAMDWAIEVQCTGAAAIQAVILAGSIQELATV